MTQSTPAHLRDVPRLEDADFIYQDYSGEEVSEIHDAALSLFEELGALAASTETR